MKAKRPELDVLDVDDMLTDSEKFNFGVFLLLLTFVAFCLIDDWGIFLGVMLLRCAGNMRRKV